MKNEATEGAFVISLDFELMWGMFDKVTHDEYGAQLDGVSSAIPKILALFQEYSIHATWATVGMLMFENVDELRYALSGMTVRPQYTNKEYSAYRHAGEGALYALPHRYFASHLVKKIIETPNQELASHTFSHYYCLEEQQIDTENAFTADAEALQNVAQKFNRTLQSIVFPRNQWNTEALTVLKKLGYKTFRGTENHILYNAKNDSRQNNPLLRIFRLIDNYINISGHHTYKLTSVQSSDTGLVNVPSSRFLRPYSKLFAFMEPLRLRRIKNTMTHAAKNGEIYHLWWHPHNFGINQEENLSFLKSILEHYKYLETKYGMKSRSMLGVATHESESLA